MVRVFNHWYVKQDEKKILWLIIDQKDAKVNVLNSVVIEELSEILNNISETIKPQGLVIKSGKTNGFIAGADINQFKSISSQAAAMEYVTKVQAIFNKLSNLPFPTIALINGFCVGGGLELALACRYRIAFDDPKTHLGLPEVMLGIQPGWGGTTRLPRLIGPLKAMNLILSGKIINANAAKKLGVVDCVVPERHFQRAVEHYIFSKPPVNKAGIFSKLLQLTNVRPLVGKLLTYKVAKKINRKHCPAPFEIIENWVEYDVNEPEAERAEALSISNLIISQTSRNLVRVFFLKEKLKGLAKKVTNFKPTHVHIIGAGVMGGDIAAWCALAGLRVSLQDQSMQAIANSLQRAKELFEKKLKLKHLIQAAQDRILPDSAGLGVARADVIIEAIIENKEAKSELFTQLETQAKKHTILATNTSTIELQDIAANMKDPTRLVGIHFFNPVAQMPLVEVISQTNTNPKLVDQAMSFVGIINKLPLPVASSPGFLVNRVLMPYLVESIILLEEGTPGPVIDYAAKSFGMPIGPIELIDIIGLDICNAAAESLNIKLPDKVITMIQAGHLGKKTGQGFYRYKKGKPIKAKVDNPEQIPEDIKDRLIMRMLNEAIACLKDGVVNDAELLDAGMIFGAGFAPFTGGPMHYIETESAASIIKCLNHLKERYGDRFIANNF